MKSSWSDTTLGELFEVSSSKRVLQEDWKTEGVPFYRTREVVILARMGHVENELFIDESLFERLRKSFSVPVEGDIMVSAIGTVGACHIVRPNDRFYYKDASVLRLHPKKAVCAKFIKLAFDTPEITDQLIRGQGSTVATLTISRMQEIRLRLPPLEEQERIAAILDQADALRRLRARALDRLNALGQAIFHEMFGDKFKTDAHNCTLGQLATRITKGESPSWQGFDYQEDGALFVTSENVGWGVLKLTNPKFVPLGFHAKLNRSQLRTNDILINLVGASIGRACIYNANFHNANINQAVGVVSLDGSTDGLTDYVLSLLLSARGQEHLLGSRVEGARANISLSDLRNFSFYLPIKSELVKFQRIMGLLQTQTKQELVAQNESNALFTSLQHHAFGGEL